MSTTRSGSGRSTKTELPFHRAIRQASSSHGPSTAAGVERELAALRERLSETEERLAASEAAHAATKEELAAAVVKAKKWSDLREMLESADE